MGEDGEDRGQGREGGEHAAVDGPEAARRGCQQHDEHRGEHHAQGEVPPRRRRRRRPECRRAARQRAAGHEQRERGRGGTGERLRLDGSEQDRDRGRGRPAGGEARARAGAQRGAPVGEGEAAEGDEPEQRPARGPGRERAAVLVRRDEQDGPDNGREGADEPADALSPPARGQRGGAHEGRSDDELEQGDEHRLEASARPRAGAASRRSRSEAVAAVVGADVRQQRERQQQSGAERQRDERRRDAPSGRAEPGGPGSVPRPRAASAPRAAGTRGSARRSSAPDDEG